MICPTCNGKGRIVMQSSQWQGGKQVYEFPEIGPCPDCHNGQQHCCEGEQEQPIAHIEGGEITYECNPNETG